jgi:hypothetical protein
VKSEKADVVQLVEPEVNESLVELLEELLVLAKEGRILDLAGVTMNSGCEFAEVYTNSALEGHCVSFLGYLRVLQLRFEREIET